LSTLQNKKSQWQQSVKKLLNTTHQEAEEQAASVVVDVLVDAEGVLAGDPGCGLVELHVQHLVVALKDLHVALVQEQMCKSWSNLTHT
jgi:hypothetical protein